MTEKYIFAKPTKLNDRGEQVIEVGFSGTRLGMSPLQMQLFEHILKGKTGVFHHGDCIGADAEAHNIIRKLFPDKWRIVIHPPVKSEYRAWCLGDEVREAKPYFVRNRDIVNECNVFLATPKSIDNVGGTWYTINYFRKILEREFGQKVNPRVGSILLPNGTVGNIIVEKEGTMKSKMRLVT